MHSQMADVLQKMLTKEHQDLQVRQKTNLMFITSVWMSQDSRVSLQLVNI